jgi:hypothetical protein
MYWREPLNKSKSFFGGLSIYASAIRPIDKQPDVWRITMNNVNRLPNGPIGSDLRRMVEPLANYICATDEPKRALMSAVASLLHEVESTNRAVITHFHTFSEN